MCRSEIFHPDRDFYDNKIEILTKFGVGSKLTSEEEKKKECDKYVLKLMNGGPVDSNGVLFHDDRVLIIPKEEFLNQKKKTEDVNMKDEGEANDILSDRIKVKSSNSRHDPVCYKNLSELKLKNLQSLFKNHKTEQTQDEDESQQSDALKGSMH